MDKNNQEFDYFFKILLLGDYSVGTTSIIERYCENRFSTFPHPIGNDKLNLKNIIKIFFYKL